MNIIKLSPYDTEKMPILVPNGYNSSSTLHIPNPKKLYKIINNSSFIQERERNIDFLLSNEPIPYTTYPTAKITINDWYAGYEMDYLEGAKTFTESIKDFNLSNEEKLNIIRNVFSALKVIHSRGVTLGDIHLDNFMIYKNSGYVCDLDDLRMPGDEFKFFKLYTLKYSNKIPYLTNDTKGTDNIKSAINCLSLIYGFDLIPFVKIFSLLDLQTILNQVLPYDIKIRLIPMFGKTNEPKNYFDEFASELLETNTEADSKKIMELILKK